MRDPPVSTDAARLEAGPAAVLIVVIAALVLAVVALGPGLSGSEPLGPSPDRDLCQNLANESTREATGFAAWHERNVRVADSLAADVESDEDPQEVLNSRLADATTTPGAASIHLVDLDSGEVEASTQGYDDYDLDDEVPREWGQPLDQMGEVGETSVVGYYRTMRANPVIVYAAPAGDDRALVYVVRAEAHESVSDRVPGRVVYVLDLSASGSPPVVYDATEQVFFQRYPEQYDDVVERLRSLQAGTHEGIRAAAARPAQGTFSASVPRNFTDDQYVPSYALVENTSFAVVIHTPRSEIGGATCDLD